MSDNLFSNILAANPVCYMLIGPPACGKSTYRAALIPRLNTPVIISGDDLIEAECARLGKTYAEVFPTVDFKAQKKTLRAAFDDAIANRLDIVIDRTNMSIKSRRSFLASLPGFYKKVGVVFHVDQAALFERLDRRGRDTGKTIPAKVVEDMMKQYQAPAPFEFDHVEAVNSFG